MSDSTKSAHTFQCRNSLWAKFEQMAHELECSVDYLINDAMKQYARQRGFGGRLSVPPPSSSRPSAAPTIQPAPFPSEQPAPYPPRAVTTPSAIAQPAGHPPLAPSLPPRLPVSMRGNARGTGQAPAVSRAPAPPPRRPAPPPPMPRGPVNMPLGGPGAAMSMGNPGAAMPMGVPAAYAAPQPMHAPASRYPLFVYYMGQRYQVSKDRFIIGRGRQSSDLTIRDPNVSRQHAMIEFLNGQYHIVDMGSTNGIEHGGQRIQRRVVQDGDSYRVCDHELRVSFQ